ncbi:MAG: glycoside hydrolase family 9 protein [Bacteroidales bacterium]|nr:glycoside hydrolase family 9 protein [Bacteroidales bacterium]
MKKLLFLSVMLALVAACNQTSKPNLVINDLEYFETQGVNVWVYSNLFSGGFNDEKDSGIEIVHHGVRTVQGGAIRLSNTPEQWDLVPSTTFRNVNKEDNSIEVGLRYNEFDFDSRVVVTGKGDEVEIAVYLDKPVPAELEGDAGFNLEFLPAQYWQKTYIMDGKYERFPRYVASNTVARPNEEKVVQYRGYKTYDDRGTGEFVDPLPLAQGRDIIMAPDAPERMIEIKSEDADLMLYDGRIVAQNGWFVLRSLLPAGKTGKVLTWTVKPHAIPGWIREPNIGFSQMGYVPSQPKVAVIELDKKDKVKSTASIIKVEDDGKEQKVFTGKTNVWGPYYKYNYVKFDFSDVRKPGVYYIEYNGVKTNNFIIADDVYDHITDATSDVWIPIHMNHMTVNEGYRIWHGEPFKEGYLQAPVNTSHFDLHSQGPTTDTKFKPLELIPGLNVGGYFDAGDFDIETGSNINVVSSLVTLWESFHPQRDETFVSEEQRYVDLHRPDGIPDVLQYIRHGVLNLLAQAEIIGHMSQTLSNSVLDNYHHLGDAAAITDGLHYDPRLKPYQKSADGKSSGSPDDMWAFTSRNPGSDFNAATMFAAASRALAGFDDDLSARCLKESKRLMKESNEIMAQQAARMAANPNAPGANRRRGGTNMATNLQLYVSTGEQNYLDEFIKQIWPALDRNVESSINTAINAVPYMDASYKEKLRPYVEQYKVYLDSLDYDNPYGVPIGLGNWAGSGSVVSYGTTVSYASEYFPDIIDKSYAYKAVNYLFGCHPYHNYSLVAAVGATRPKAVFYGNNRADFSFIPGNVAPGLLFRHPDHFENYDDWPFLWGQNEGTIAGNTSYLIFGSVFKDLVKQ